MGSLDVDSLFTNIPLEETINICTNLRYNNEDVIEGINKSEFKNLLSLATQELSFLKQVFLKNGYPLSFIDNCFKTFVDKLFIKRPQLATVEKKTFFCHYHTLEKFPYKLEQS